MYFVLKAHTTVLVQVVGSTTTFHEYRDENNTNIYMQFYAKRTLNVSFVI